MALTINAIKIMERKKKNLIDNAKPNNSIQNESNEKKLVK